MSGVTRNRRPRSAPLHRTNRSRRIADRPVRLADLQARYRPEILALVAAYLRAFGTGDAATADGLLGSCEPTELIAGLTVLACVLSDDLGAQNGIGTGVVLERTWRRCAAHHRVTIGLS